MKKILALLAASLALSFGAAHAAEDGKTKQQQKMTTCNADAKDKALTGDERKAFMKECLSAKSDAKPSSKLGACSKEAAEKGLKGDERTKYLSECNKKK